MIKVIVLHPVLNVCMSARRRERALYSRFAE